MTSPVTSLDQLPAAFARRFNAAAPRENVMRVVSHSAEERHGVEAWS